MPSSADNPRGGSILVDLIPLKGSLPPRDLRSSVQSLRPAVLSSLLRVILFRGLKLGFDVRDKAGISCWLIFGELAESVLWL